MDVCLAIKQRLEKLGLEQRGLAAAAQVTESYIPQLLTRKKAHPAVDRTDLYERMNAFLRLPKRRLSAMVEAQRREDLKKKLADPPAPLLKEVRELVVRKCKTERQIQMRDIFERQAFGEVERLVTQKLLDVTKRIAKDELKNEYWLRIVARLRNRSYEEVRALILEFLDTDVFNASPDHCSAFLGPLVVSRDIDLKAFGMGIVLNRRLTSMQLTKFQFVEIGSNRAPEEESGFKEFIRNASMSGDIAEEEIEFLRSPRFKQNRPSPLYYYRELQSLRDPLHFRESSAAPMHNPRDASGAEKQLQLDSKKRAVRRWAKNKINPRNRAKSKPPSAPRPGRKEIG